CCNKHHPAICCRSSGDNVETRQPQGFVEESNLTALDEQDATHVRCPAATTRVGEDTIKLCPQRARVVTAFAAGGHAIKAILAGCSDDIAGDDCCKGDASC